ALLGDRRFPAPLWIRGYGNLEYTPEADAFHDLFGHIPQLLRPEFCVLLESLSDQAAAANDETMLRIERLYWFSFEFGLTLENGELRAIGAGLASSVGELERSLHSDRVERLAFTRDRACSTPFSANEQQALYLVAESTESLKTCLHLRGNGDRSQGEGQSLGPR
ncbi:MAG: phenylalanine-4-hydroxylase, partial [Gammaproteobacteria bacterium]